MGWLFNRFYLIYYPLKGEIKRTGDASRNVGIILTSINEPFDFFNLLVCIAKISCRSIYGRGFSNAFKGLDRLTKLNVIVYFSLHFRYSNIFFVLFSLGCFTSVLFFLTIFVFGFSISSRYSSSSSPFSVSGSLSVSSIYSLFYFFLFLFFSILYFFFIVFLYYFF